MSAVDQRRVLYAEFTALPGNRAAVASLIQGLRGRVNAEPGNLLFEVSTRADQPDSFFVYEQYRDAASFEAHASADYGARFNEELNALIVEDHSILTWLEPVL